MSIPRICGRIHAFLASLGLACLALAGPAIGASSFRVEQVYSNLDGSVQYIRLRESAGRDGEHHIGGLVITVTGGGVAKSITIPRDLWWPTTAGQPVQITTLQRPLVCCAMSSADWPQDYSEYGYYIEQQGAGHAPSDYAILPERFLPVGGGTITLADADTVVYPPLPVDGYHAVDRNGLVVRAEVRSFVRSINPFGIVFPEPDVHEVIPTAINTREYYHAGLDHYFVTAHAADIDAIERGALPGWELTVWSFAVDPSTGPVPVSRLVPQVLEFDGVPVCRYYLPPPLGNSHFISASPAECAAVAVLIPGAILETPAAFHVALADPVTGACIGDRPSEDFSYKVYRLWNGRADTNHRYTMSPSERTAMIARGWRPEGFGPEGVAFCASTAWSDWYWDWW